MGKEKTGCDSSLPLTKFEVRNYGCLRDTEISFSPITVLVGPNDSGKTMLLNALDSLGLGTNGAPNAFRDAQWFRTLTSDQNALPISFLAAGCSSGLTYSYWQEVSCSADSLHVSNEELKLGAEQDPQSEFLTASRTPSATRFRYRDNGTIQDVKVGISSEMSIFSRAWMRSLFKPEGRLASKQALQPYLESIIAGFDHAVAFRLDPEQLRQPSGVGTDSYPPFSRNGNGIARALADILLYSDELVPKIDAIVQESLAHVRKIRVKHDQGRYVLDLRTTSGAHVDHRLISDGVLLFLAFVLLAIGPQPRPIIVVEEPEIGIHPALLGQIISFLRKLTVGEHGGSPVQVILTTHSPVLLNFVEPHEIRVVQRTEPKGTQVFPFDKAHDLKRLLEYQGPGEIWVNMSEDYITAGAAAS